MRKLRTDFTDKIAYGYTKDTQLTAYMDEIKFKKGLKFVYTKLGTGNKITHNPTLCPQTLTVNSAFSFAILRKTIKKKSDVILTSDFHLLS